MTLTAASHPAKFRGGVKYNYLIVCCVHKPGYIYHILRINGAHHLLIIVSRNEIVSFVSTAFITMGLALSHCGTVSYTSA
jgi:hypothetical protein